MKRLLALLLGGLGLRALLRRRVPVLVGPSPADDLRAKLDESRTEPVHVEPAREPEAAEEPAPADRRADVHARARAVIDELKIDELKGE